MRQVVELPKQPDERDRFDALRERWKHERLPDGEIKEDGAQFLAVWALIVYLGIVAAVIGFWIARVL